MIERANKIFDRILDIGAGASGVILMLIMLVVSVKVFFRYVLTIGIVGIDELSGLALLYITFFAGGWVLKHGGHVIIDLLSSRFTPRIRRWLGFITSIIGMVLCAVLMWYGTAAMVDLWQKGIVTPTELELSRAAIISVIPFGFMLLAIQFLRHASDYARNKVPGVA